MREAGRSDAVVSVDPVACDTGGRVKLPCGALTSACDCEGKAGGTGADSTDGSAGGWSAGRGGKPGGGASDASEAGGCVPVGGVLVATCAVGAGSDWSPASNCSNWSSSGKNEVGEIEYKRSLADIVCDVLLVLTEVTTTELEMP